MTIISFFLNLDSSPSYMNYATIGWFIGHEITHGKAYEFGHLEHMKIFTLGVDKQIFDLLFIKASTMVADSSMQKAI